MIIVHAYTVKMWILLKGNYWVTTIAECTANSYNFVNHTFTISSSNDMLISIFPSKMVYFCLKTPITRSICIRTDESWEEVSTSNWSPGSRWYNSPSSGNTATPCLWNNSLWDHSNEKLYSDSMLFIVAPGLCSRFQAYRSFNEHFKAIYKLMITQVLNFF